MLVHLLLNKINSLGTNITSKVIKTGKLPQQRKQRITHRTAKLHKLEPQALSLIQLSKISNFNHFPFQISSIPKKIAFVVLVEFIPYFLGVLLRFEVLLLGGQG